jgi:Protein of unknown function (DUF2845)
LDVSEEKVMNMRTTKISIIATLILFGSQTVMAGSIRCGGRIISDGKRNGTGQYEVLKKCGEPTERIGNNWIYEKQNKRNVIVFKDNGTIASIHQVNK